jgi:non-SMC mitotic condensation complex subunit 1, N-term
MVVPILIGRRNFDHVKPKFLARLLDIVLSAFRHEVKATADDIEANEKESFATHKTVLEMYGFIVHWYLITIEDKASSMAGKSKVWISLYYSGLLEFFFSNHTIVIIAR